MPLAASLTRAAWFALPAYEVLGREDPLEEREVEQMLVGVAARKYGRSLEPLPATVAHAERASVR